MRFFRRLTEGIFDKKILSANGLPLQCVFDRHKQSPLSPVNSPGRGSR